MCDDGDLCKRNDNKLLFFGTTLQWIMFCFIQIFVKESTAAAAAARCSHCGVNILVGKHR